MSNDTNVAIVLGTIIRAEPVKGQDGRLKSLRVALGAYEETVGNEGRPLRLPVYQNVVVYGKDASEFAGKVGDPYVVLGTLRQTSWKDEQDRYRENTVVKATSFRPAHGIAQDRIVADAQGNPMLQGGYAHVTLLGKVSRDPEYKILSGGNTLLQVNIASGEEWQQGEERKEHTNWVRATLWREMADALEGLGLSKGTTLFGTYRITNGKKYEDRKTGLTRYPVDLVPLELPIVIGRRNEQPSATSIPTKGAFAGRGAASSLDDLGDFDFPADEAVDDEVALF